MTIAHGIFTILAAALAALVAAPLVRRAAQRAGAVDLPEARKLHTEPVPRLGGVAVLAAALLAIGAAAPTTPGLLPALAAGAAPLRWTVIALATLLVFLLGAVDDLRGLKPRLKLLIELLAAAAVVAVAPAPRALALASGGPVLEVGPLGPVLAALWIAAVANALNMTDVADGVAGGLAAIAALALGLVAVVSGKVVSPVVLFALCGALLGFLPHNVFTRRLFLGDSGSLTAGFLLGAGSVVALVQNGVWNLLPGLLALGPILAELALTISRRALIAVEVVDPGQPAAPRLRWRRPGFFVPDRRHVPHRLLDLGLTQGGMLRVLYGAGILGGALALVALVRPRLALAIGVAGAAFLGIAAPALYQELRLGERGVLRALRGRRAPRAPAPRESEG